MRCLRDSFLAAIEYIAILRTIVLIHTADLYGGESYLGISRRGFGSIMPTPFRSHLVYRDRRVQLAISGCVCRLASSPRRRIKFKSSAKF